MELIYSFFGNPRDYASLSPDLLPLTALFALHRRIDPHQVHRILRQSDLADEISALFIGAMGSNWVLKTSSCRWNRPSRRRSWCRCSA